MSSNVLLTLCRSLALGVLALSAGQATAQSVPAELAGIYDGGQTEIGAALQLGEDGRFQYFMSYGAVDEIASGTWSADAEGIILDSDPVSAPSFALVDSKGGGHTGFRITLDVPEGMPIQVFSVRAFLAGGGERWADFENPQLDLELERGEVVTGVMLQLPLYLVLSEKFAVPPKAAGMHFRFEPNDLGTLDFDRQVLLQEDGAFLLKRYDRVLKFRKESEEAYPGDEPDPVEPPDPAAVLAQVTGAWAFTGEDCDPDTAFPPRADMPGATFTLSPDYTYRLSMTGMEPSGNFTLTPYEYYGSDYFLIKLEQAQLTFIVNGDRLESWSDDAVKTQCTQLFERPAAD